MSVKKSTIGSWLREAFQKPDDPYPVPAEGERVRTEDPLLAAAEDFQRSQRVRARPHVPAPEKTAEEHRKASDDAAVAAGMTAAETARRLPAHPVQAAGDYYREAPDSRGVAVKPPTRVEELPRYLGEIDEPERTFGPSSRDENELAWDAIRAMRAEFDANPTERNRRALDKAIAYGAQIREERLSPEERLRNARATFKDAPGRRTAERYDEAIRGASPPRYLGEVDDVAPRAPRVRDLGEADDPEFVAPYMRAADERSRYLGEMDPPRPRVFTPKSPKMTPDEVVKYHRDRFMATGDPRDERAYQRAVDQAVGERAYGGPSLDSALRDIATEEDQRSADAEWFLTHGVR